MQHSPLAKQQYFDVIRALKKGGLSLWLNRKILLPMTLVPTIVTFFTLMVSRFDGMKDASAFQMSLIQIPADFVTGIFCALIAFIIMNAPKKDDKAKPVIFQLNILERKDLLVRSAIAYVVFGYLLGGLYGGAELIYEQVKLASENKQPPSTIYFILMITIMAVLFYAMRFIVMPILFIAQIDVVSFFKHFKNIGFSVPIFLIKFLITVSVGVVLYIPLQALSGPLSGEEVAPIQMAFLDISFAFGSIIAAAWTTSSLAIGLRQMIEKNK